MPADQPGGLRVRGSSLTMAISQMAAAAALDLPPVIGHRGAAAYAPENTLTGFCAAKSLGCAWVEFDVRLTGDEMPVICHDNRLDRTTSGRGNISKLSLAALRRFDAGSWFGAGFAGERIPTLEEALSCCRDLGLGANLEIKAERSRGPATATAIASCLDKLTGGLPPLLISSFLAKVIAATAALVPSIPRGILWRKIPRNWRTIAAQLGCTTIHCSHVDLTREGAEEVRTAGYPLLVYTVNDDARARQLFGWGVTSVFSDAPDIIGRATAPDSAGAWRGALS
jgi:glycerophosphoryl diester phosphodiesterase